MTPYRAVMVKAAEVPPLASAELWHLLQVYTCFDKDFAAVDCKAVTSWGICTGDVTIPMPDTVLSLSNGNLTRTQ